MPYVNRDRRFNLDPFVEGLTNEMAGEFSDAGAVNYVITKIIDDWLGRQPTYAKINSAIGVLQCVQMELYRRVAAPYEDSKMMESGDVYRRREYPQPKGTST